MYRRATHLHKGASHIHQKQTMFVFRLACVFMLAGIIAACNASSTITPTPLSPSPVPQPTATQAAPLAAATRVPSPTPVSSPTVPPGLVTDDIQYSGALSVEDLNTLLLAIRALKGVQDAQGGVQDLMITYDRNQVSRQKIIDVIKSFGYTVKE